jgi:hypothetical protein
MVDAVGVTAGNEADSPWAAFTSAMQAAVSLGRES